MARTNPKSKSKLKKSPRTTRAAGARHLRLVPRYQATVGAGPTCDGSALSLPDAGTWKLVHDDCINAMRRIEPNSVDSVVCDPPYALSFMGAHWDIYTAGEFQAFCQAWGAEALRVLKPGGYLLAFSSARTYHRLTCGLEDAGFAIVDQLQWLTAQGMPKSRSIGRQLGHASKTALATALKPAHEPIVVAQKPREGSYVANVRAHGVGAMNIDGCRVGSVTTGADAAGRWPANVLVGHSRDCRQLGDAQVGCRAHWGKTRVSGYGSGIGNGRALYDGAGQRPGKETAESWECTADCSVAALNRQGEEATAGPSAGASRYFLTVAGDSPPSEVRHASVGILPMAGVLTGEDPSFLYCPKVKGPSERDAGLGELPARSWVQFQTANGSSGEPSSWSADRAAVRRNTHATVKPIALMRWLLRLVTPPGGTTLDPFCGSGSTGCAVMVENADPDRAPDWSFIGIEREAEYVAIAQARIAHWAAASKPDFEGADSAQVA